MRIKRADSSWVERLLGATAGANRMVQKPGLLYYESITGRLSARYPPRDGLRSRWM